jgi:hypothetical protein
MFMPYCGKYFFRLGPRHKADTANDTKLFGINGYWQYSRNEGYHIVFIDSSLCDTNHSVFAKTAGTPFH